jgi:hypothetical protein
MERMSFRWEMPKFRPSANRRQGRIAQWLLAKMEQFPSLFPEAPRFCQYLLKVKGTAENFENPQRVFSYLCSFHPYQFWPKSNWCGSPFKSQATVPLNLAPSPTGEQIQH